MGDMLDALAWPWRTCAKMWRKTLAQVKFPVDRFEDQKFPHLSPENIRWGNPDHQRAAAAVLVQAVYALAATNEEASNVEDAQKYWDFLGFERMAEFDMKESNFIIGAVFKHKIRPTTPAGAPKYVIAFRGTHDLYDALNDFYIMKGIFKYSPRMMELKNKFAKFFSQVPDAKTSNLWLTGHSLGSTIAMLLVVEMLRSDPNFLRGINMRTLLFNPPCAAVDGNQNIFNWLREAVNRFADVLIEMFGLLQLQLVDEKGRRLMSNWKPELYVNEEDVICKSYIDYFEKEWYKSVPVLPGGKSATIMLPSAELVKYTRKYSTEKLQDMSLIEKLIFVHTLKQWWEPNLVLLLHPKTYLQPPSLAPSFK